MTFDELLTQVLALLRRDGRASYRARRRRFDLDEEYLEDLKTEIIQAKQLAVTAIGLYRSMDMTFWLAQAEAALTQVA
jgi:hypothetical protein